MLIRSQNKKNIFVLENSESVGIYEMFESGTYKTAGYSICTNNCRMGEYSTEEKAIKVMDEICDTYRDDLYTDCIYDDSAKANIPHLMARNTVYQMPQDGEVKI